MDKLTSKKRPRAAPTETPVEQPDHEQIDKNDRRMRGRRRQNNTVLGSPAGRTLG